MEPVRFRDSHGGQSPLRKEGVLQILSLTALIMQTEKELQEFVGAGVRVALCSLCISILAFVPPLLYASVSPCVSAYLRCKKQQAIPWLGFRRGADVGSSVAL